MISFLLDKQKNTGWNKVVFFSLFSNEKKHNLQLLYHVLQMF